MIRPEPVILVHFATEGTGRGTGRTALTACTGEEFQADGGWGTTPRMVCPLCQHFALKRGAGQGDGLTPIESLLAALERVPAGQQVDAHQLARDLRATMQHYLLLTQP